MEFSDNLRKLTDEPHSLKILKKVKKKLDMSWMPVTHIT